MNVPARVRKGTTSSYYYWDGVGPMTLLANGWGDILNDDPGFDVPLVELSSSDFDVMQAELLGRELAFFDRLDARVNGV
jgi:hypothetical protein